MNKVYKSVNYAARLCFIRLLGFFLRKSLNLGEKLKIKVRKKGG